MKAFTDTYLKNLKPTGKEYFVREGRGFTLRVRKTGLKTFFFIYTENGKRKYLHLGEYPSTTLAQARTAYNSAYEKNRLGIDLVQPLFPPEPEHKDIHLFSEFHKEYLKWSEVNHSPAWSNTLKCALEKDVLPVLGNKGIQEIRRRDVILLLEEIQRRAPGQVPTIHKALSGIFEYAVQRDYLDSNPVLRMSKAVPALKYTPKDRVLTEEEIKTIWYALDDTPAHRAIKLILVTAQRPGEVAGLQWQELDIQSPPGLHGRLLGEVWWTLPKERAEKGKGDHLIYLTETALRLIEPSNRTTYGVFNVKRNSLSQVVCRKEYFNLPAWTPHDLRRTARTFMAKIGVPNEHAEAVINHAKPGMVQVYNKYEYQEEKKAALLRWETELLRILTKKPNED